MPGKDNPDPAATNRTSPLGAKFSWLKSISPGQTPICAFGNRGRKWKTVNAFARLRIGWMEHAMNGLDRLARRRGSQVPAHLLTGIEGEDAAFFYLRRKGYVVVARRWSCGERPGDVDLIAWDGPALCFIEVKTRTAHDMTPAEAAVDGHKRHVLRRLAHQYLRQLPGESRPPIRFDVISVYLVSAQPREFVHFEGAFGWSEHVEAR
jgi:putative endonuclease